MGGDGRTGGAPGPGGSGVFRRRCSGFQRQRWSSYPGHIHPQPEWYLYKFQKEGGYGQAQNGDHVYCVYENDVLRIHPDHVHAQVSAPGYFMYYLWAVRHLEANPYTGFTYLDQRHVDVFFGEK